MANYWKIVVKYGWSTFTIVNTQVMVDNTDINDQMYLNIISHGGTSMQRDTYDNMKG